MTDTKHHALHNFFESLKSEHCELVGVLGNIRHALATGTREEEEIEQLVTQMCNQIEAHFLAEEEGGYLHDVLEHAPGLKARADELHRQHASLLAQARNLRDLVRRLAQKEVGRGEFHQAFEAFANELMTHEGHEDDLVRRSISPSNSGPRLDIVSRRPR